MENKRINGIYEFNGNSMEKCNLLNELQIEKEYI